MADGMNPAAWQGAPRDMYSLAMLANMTPEQQDYMRRSMMAQSLMGQQQPSTRSMYGATANIMGPMLGAYMMPRGGFPGPNVAPPTATSVAPRLYGGGGVPSPFGAGSSMAPTQQPSTLSPALAASVYAPNQFALGAPQQPWGIPSASGAY